MTILKASHTQKLFSLMFVLAIPLWLTSSLRGQSTISTGALARTGHRRHRRRRGRRQGNHHPG